MLGAIAGDIIGSYYEFRQLRRKSTDFPLFNPESRFTDDTVMTLAVAKWLLEDPGHTPEVLVRCMLELGRRYPLAGYGNRFRQWLKADNPQPIDSFGNGSAMRVSPVGMYARTLEQALELARVSAAVSHNHPEGIRGAQVTAGCVFLARQGKPKAEIRAFAESMGYTFERTVAEMRPDYGFDATCQGSVPQSIQCYLEGEDYEQVIRLAISMGGDADTMAAIAGAIAAPNGLTGPIADECRKRLTPDLCGIMDNFERMVSGK